MAVIVNSTNRVLLAFPLLREIGRKASSVSASDPSLSCQLLIRVCALTRFLPIQLESPVFQAEQSHAQLATKLYCFVHNVPVCGECICFAEHRICVLWPPKNFKDSGSRFHSLLREAILQSGIEKNLFGNHPVVKTSSDPPLLSTSASSLNNGKIVNDGYIPTNGTGSKLSVSDIVEVDVPSSAGNLMKSTSPVGAGATTRKGAFPVDQQSSDVPHYSDDEDGNRKKYSRRGSFRRKFLRALLPFWSSSLPTLPVTAPPRKDALNTDDASEGRLRHKKSRTDPQKILLFIAIIACLATMGILYYRIAQGGFGDDPIDEDQQ
ncbi:hypothetical protein CDL15_Pgr003339 [Punica granatum]|uniref:ZFPL1-like B-box zinc-binding domain-containing protein n=1 Tax=Punica granatum TaxID=22663 RepID=A0A218X2W9_PUNGR|nr:hypothetical protein CDL15_Pgr003339 [Punica granatum]